MFKLSHITPQNINKYVASQ